jgi:hypothetical protein
MNQAIATIIAAIIAVLGVIGTAVASIIAVLINTKKNEQISRLKVFQDLQIDYDVDLRKRRIDSYLELLKHMVALAKYPEPEALSYEQIQKLALAFRDWYFTSGGLIASEKTRDHYFDVQDAFKIILHKRSNKWCPDEAALKSAFGLSLYLERNESRPAPPDVVAIATSEVPGSEYLPQTVNAHLRALGSTLRTSMTEDVLTRADPALRREEIVLSTRGIS